MSTVLIVIAWLVAIPAIVASVHLTTLSLASIFYRTTAVSNSDSLRILVVVPARNEEAVIAATVSSLTAAMREHDVLLVVADRCSDGTAAIAKAGGAEVLDRPDSANPGRAAAIADGIDHASEWPWDVVTTVDADSVVNEEFFAALDSVFSGGASIAQPRSEHIRERGILSRIAEAAFSMQGVTLPRGRTRLGIGVRLRGSGMAMRREIVMKFPFSTGGVSEDMFYSLDLILEDIEAVHVDDARIHSLVAPSVSAGATQRIRWEVGRLAAAKTYMLPLLRHGSLTSVEVAVLLGTPPFALAVFLLLLGAGLVFVAGATSVVFVFLGFVGFLALDLAIGLIQSRAPWQTWGALLAAPVYIVWKAGLQVAAIAGIRSSDQAYEPTVRR